ncbi:hypothetical protein FB451DRAFT_1284130 [Mycena latifolia]|nr:hypothetical protein FB451DRAFT_1284130 [Mycena latifolia]
MEETGSVTILVLIIVHRTVNTPHQSSVSHRCSSSSSGDSLSLLASPPSPPMHPVNATCPVPMSLSVAPLASPVSGVVPKSGVVLDQDGVSSPRTPPPPPSPARGAPPPYLEPLSASTLSRCRLVETTCLRADNAKVKAQVQDNRPLMKPHTPEQSVPPGTNAQWKAEANSRKSTAKSSKGG